MKTMLCHDCRKREAAKKFTQIINNEKTVLALCNECAEARGFHSPLAAEPFPLAEILSTLSKSLTITSKSEPMPSLVCPSCKLTFEEFTRLGRFGCGDCYRTFRPRLESIMRKIHGASLHRGKNPSVQAPTGNIMAVLPIKEEERLENELKKAIEAEDFERAAEIRDKLKSIRDSIGVQP
jgi:protein arginine kinase activator